MSRGFATPFSASEVGLNFPFSFRRLRVIASSDEMAPDHVGAPVVISPSGWGGGTWSREPVSSHEDQLDDTYIATCLAIPASVG